MASQKLGRLLRDAGSNGIAFDSVRRDGGECVAIFRPRLVQNVRQSVHLRYAWDGNSIANVYEIAWSTCSVRRGPAMLISVSFRSTPLYCAPVKTP